jgi:hypothetical protein
MLNWKLLLAIFLDEIVLIGYGTQKRSEVTSSISKINANETANMWHLVLRRKLPVKQLVFKLPIQQV